MPLVKYELVLGVDQSSLIPRQHFMIYLWGLQVIDCFFSWMERYFVRWVFWVSKQESLKPCSHRSSASVLTLSLEGHIDLYQYHSHQASTSSSSLALMLWSASHTHSQASTLTLGVNRSLYMQKVRLKRWSYSIACMDVQKTLGYLSRAVHRFWTFKTNAFTTRVVCRFLFKTAILAETITVRIKSIYVMKEPFYSVIGSSVTSRKSQSCFVCNNFTVLIIIIMKLDSWNSVMYFSNSVKQKRTKITALSPRCIGADRVQRDVYPVQTPFLHCIVFLNQTLSLLAKLFSERLTYVIIIPPNVIKRCT